MTTDHDDLQQIPWRDAKALRMVEAIERSIVRLLIDSLRALASARPMEDSRRRRLDQCLSELLDRVSPAPR